MTDTQILDSYNTLPVLTYGEISEKELLDDLQIILQWKSYRFFISEDIPNNTFTVKEYWLLLGILNDTNCIDYGTSPRSAWLTEFGEELLQFLKDGKQIGLFEDYFDD